MLGARGDVRSWPALLLAGAVLLTSACTAARVRTAAGVPRAREMKDVPASTLHVVDAARFGGTWYMIISDFPRWKSPRYRDPTYVYEPLDHPDLTLYRDTVHFQRNGRKRAWRGVDIQDPDRAGHFQWRGDGGLYGVAAQWFVVAVDPEYQWAVVYFHKSSVGSPGGLEILARTPVIPEADLHAALRAIYADPALAARVPGLAAARHGDAAPPTYDLKAPPPEPVAPAEPTADASSDPAPTKSEPSPPPADAPDGAPTSAPPRADEPPPTTSSDAAPAPKVDAPAPKVDAPAPKADAPAPKSDAGKTDASTEDPTGKAAAPPS